MPVNESPPVLVHSVEDAVNVPLLIVRVLVVAVAGRARSPAETVTALTVNGEYDAKLPEKFDNVNVPLV